MLDTLLCLVAILALSAFFTRLRGGNSAFAPLLALGCCMLYFTVAGVLNVLVAAGWLFYAACFGLGAFAFFKGRLALLKKMLTPGFVLFGALALVLLLYFAVRQPVFSEWDEFVFWGTAPKLVKFSGQLYPAANIGWFWTQTQSPGLIVLSWFCQFFSPGFAAWKVLWINDVLMLACVAALIAPFGFARWRTALPLAVAGLLAPFFFGVVNGTINLSTVWMNAYADLPGGMLLAGTLGVYFALRRTSRGGLWLAALPLAALALVKDNVMPAALVAAAVMAADCVFFGTGQRPAPGGAALAAHPPRLKTGLMRGGAAVGWFAAVAAPYLLWQQYTAHVVAQKSAAGAGGATNISTLAAVGKALGEVLGLAPRGEQTNAVLAELWNSFLGRANVGGEVSEGLIKASMAGSGLVTVALILGIFVLAVLLAKGWRRKTRTGLTGIILVGGFLGYQFMLLVFYAFVHHAREVVGVVDYSRYLGTYYVGWLLCGLLLLALAPAPAEEDAKKRPAAMALAQAGVLAVALFMTLRFAVLVRPGYSVLDYPDTFLDAKRQQQALTEEFARHMDPASRVFLVCQGGNGEEWFTYSQYFLPIVLDYSVSGGDTLSGARLAWEVDRAGEVLTDDESVAFLADYLSRNQCDYILVQQTDAWFTKVCGVLFEDKLASFTGEPVLYERAGGGLYAPVAKGG